MMALRFLQANYLAQYAADFGNYFNQKSIIMDVVGREIVKQTVPGLFLYLFDMEMALARGEYDHLLDLATQALATNSKLLSPNMRSQTLQYQTLALAMKDKRAEALAAKNYLKLQSGILCLENCRVDAIEFSKKTKQGLAV